MKRIHYTVHGENCNFSHINKLCSCVGKWWFSGACAKDLHVWGEFLGWNDFTHHFKQHVHIKTTAPWYKQSLKLKLCRISILLSVNAPFKVGPCYLAQGARQRASRGWASWSQWGEGALLGRTKQRIREIKCYFLIVSRWVGFKENTPKPQQTFQIVFECSQLFASLLCFCVCVCVCVCSLILGHTDL